MNAFILFAVQAFTAETKAFQHALIRPAKNERVRRAFKLQFRNKWFQHVLIRPAEMSAFVFWCFQLSPPKHKCSNTRWWTNPLKMNVFVLLRFQFSLQTIHRFNKCWLDPLKMDALICWRFQFSQQKPKYSNARWSDPLTENKAFQHVLMWPVK